MNILLFGVSNVGKSVSGWLLAGLLGYSFYDLNDEVKKDQNTTLEEFVSTENLMKRDAIRCRILNHLICKRGNKVIAVTPLSYINGIRCLFSSPDVISIVLTDSAENIFDRLIFSDENDVVYKDDDYKNAHRDYYIREIKKDIWAYTPSFLKVKNKFYMDGDSPERVVERIVAEYGLKCDRKKT